MPTHLTHYTRGEPFRSLTAAPPATWSALVADLTDDRVWGRARFADPHYLPRRRAVEAQLHAAFLALGGEPQVEQPFYCVVGRSARWEHGQRAGMRAHIVDLSRIPLKYVSFTFGDSLVCTDPDYRAEAIARGQPLTPYHGRLVRAEDLATLEAQIRAEAALAPAQDFAPQLEAQLWLRPPPEAVQVVAVC